MQARSPTLRLRARGGLACFTRPELKAERVSYPVITPSAARGILESVLWKPAIRWHVRRVLVLAPISFIAFRRNEVNSKASAPAAPVVRDGGPAPSLFADDDRAQRNTLALRDVDYVIEASMTMTARTGPDDNMTKFVAMFERRIERGQCFQQPYLGCREFPAEVLPADGSEEPVRITRDLGIVLWDVDFRPEGNRPLFFPARLVDGVMEVPTEPLSPATGGGPTA